MGSIKLIDEFINICNLKETDSDEVIVLKINNYIENVKDQEDQIKYSPEKWTAITSILIANSSNGKPYSVNNAIKNFGERNS